MELKICTFNVRSVYLGEDGVNSFLFRSGMILEKIQRVDDDGLSVDLQELLGAPASHADAASAGKNNGNGF